MNETNPLSETETAELAAYRSGGVTEEILRRKDGYLRIGPGVSVISNTTLREWQDIIKVLSESLEASNSEISRLIKKAAPLGDFGTRARELVADSSRLRYSGLPDGATESTANANHHEGT